MAKQVKCNYKMCDNLGVAVEPVKYKNKYYCKTCLEKLQKEEKEKLAKQEKENKIKVRNAELRKKIMDTVLAILPQEIPSLINKVVTQWIALDYSMEYILYTTEYIRLNKCVLNHVHGIRYYMNKDEIKNAYKQAKKKHEMKKVENVGFEISNEEEGFSYNSNDNYLNIL